MLPGNCCGEFSAIVPRVFLTPLATKLPHVATSRALVLASTGSTTTDVPFCRLLLLLRPPTHCNGRVIDVAITL
jgi:hypothetical protein